MKGRHPHTCPADYKIISRQASFKPPSSLYSSQGIPQMWGVLKGHRGETYPHTESVCWASHPHSWEKGGFFFSTVTQHFQDFQDSIPKSILTVYFLEELFLGRYAKVFLGNSIFIKMFRGFLFQDSLVSEYMCNQCMSFPFSDCQLDHKAHSPLWSPTYGFPISSAS